LCFRSVYCLLLYHNVLQKLGKMGPLQSFSSQKIPFWYDASMKINTDPKKIEELLTRGVDEVIHLDDLRAKLLSGKQLRVKLGIDPTSPHLHLGRSIPLLKLRDFQELGHQIILLIGDATGVIGDTSDKDAERPMLTPEQVKENHAEYYDQAAKILDMDKVEFRQNSEWLNPLGYTEIGEHADLFSVNQFIQRDNIRRRLEAGKRVSLREVLYPLMQGYDSVALKADVELGGSDQRFNLLAGRTLQEHFNQAPQNIVTNPLVEGLDGRKMSSSYGNGVYIFDTPADMYGKIMSLHDAFIIKYYIFMTRIPMQDITAIQHELSQKDTNPKDIKMRLAHALVSMYHSEDAANIAQTGWQEAFEQGKIPENTKTVKVKVKIPLVELLMKEGIVKSKTEFKRLVENGAIKFHGQIQEKKIIDPASLVSEDGALKIGKKRFLKIKVIKDAKKAGEIKDSEKKEG